MSISNQSETRLLTEIFQNINDALTCIDLISSGGIASMGNINLELLKDKLQANQQGIIKMITSQVLRQAMEQDQSLINPTVSNNDSIGENNIKDQFGLREANELIHRIELRAKSLGLSVVCAVCNSAANPIAIHCMDDAYIASFDVARNKAYTSAALRMSTSLLKELSQPGKELYGIQHTNEGRIIIFGGGEPLYHNNKMLGSIGVSGASEPEDDALAKYGKDILKEVMK